MGTISSIPDFWTALPEIILAILGMALLMVGVFRKNSTPLIIFWSQISLAIVLGFVLLTPSIRQVTFETFFVSDAFSIFTKVLFLGGALVLLLISRKALPQEGLTQFEYPILMLFSLLGMMVMVSANDFLSLFVGMELQSLSLYIITTLRKDNLKSSEAGLKYFVLGALATGLFLYGCTFIYGASGTTNFDKLDWVLSKSTYSHLGIMIGFTFVLVGIAFKVSVVPFHMWTPDVYQGTPTSVTAFLATSSKIAGFAVLVRFLVGPFHSLFEEWQYVVMALSIASMTVGALAALNQKNIKRLLAYSTIANMGYAMIGLVVPQQGGVRASLIYMLIYFVTTLAFFACLVNLTRRGQEISEIDDLRGIVKTFPGTTFAMGFMLFSLAGMPPLAGFLGKLYIFQAAIEADLSWLALYGIVTSVVSAAYYLRVLKVISMDLPRATTITPLPGTRQDPILTSVLVMAVFFMSLLFVVPEPFVKIIDTAAVAVAAK